MSRIKNIFIATLFCFCMSLESMERFFKSLQFSPKKTPAKVITIKKTRKKTNELNNALNLARKENNFRILAQLPCNVKKSSVKKIKMTNMLIQRYFLKEIENADTLEALQELHVEILNKIDFISNTREYELLAQNIYDKHLTLNKH